MTPTPGYWFDQLSTERPEASEYDPEVVTEEVKQQAAHYADLSFLLLPADQRPKRQEPEVLLRSDEVPCFYRGKFNLLYGDPESAKTWVAKLAIAQTLNDGGTAAFIDLDHNGAMEIATDIVLLGVDAQTVVDNLRIYEPEDGNSLHLCVADINQWSPGIAVLDSLGELLPMLGLKSNDNDEVTRALRTVLFPLTSCGACVIGIDHLPKGTPGMARNTDFSIGGIAKKRAVNGLMVRVEKTEDFAPGKVGRSKLIIVKDRIGSVRKHSVGEYLGTFVLDSTDPHTSRAYISAPKTFTGAEGEELPAHLMVRVSEWSSTFGGEFSKSVAVKEVLGRATDVRKAVDLLAKYGFLNMERVGSYEKFTHAKAFTLDDADNLTKHPIESPHWGLTE